MNPPPFAIATIQDEHPEFYDAAFNLVSFEHLVDNHFKNVYGDMTIEYIMETNNFTNEIFDTQKSVSKKTKFAQTYQTFFDIFAQTTYDLQLQVGKDQAYILIDYVKTYIKSTLN
jgi:hypothetical protein